MISVAANVVYQGLRFQFFVLLGMSLQSNSQNLFRGFRRKTDVCQIQRITLRHRPTENIWWLLLLQIIAAACYLVIGEVPNYILVPLLFSTLLVSFLLWRHIYQPDSEAITNTSPSKEAAESAINIENSLALLSANHQELTSTGEDIRHNIRSSNQSAKHQFESLQVAASSA